MTASTTLDMPARLDVDATREAKAVRQRERQVGLNMVEDDGEESGSWRAGVDGLVGAWVERATPLARLLAFSSSNTTASNEEGRSPVTIQI